MERYAVGIGLAVSLAANALFGEKIGGAASTTPLTPPDMAFSIWLPIYVLLAALAVLHVRDGAPPLGAWLLCASLVCSGLWVLAFTRLESKLPAAVVLTATFALAAPAYLNLNNRHLASLYVGWVFVAAAIGWAILAPATWPAWVRATAYLILATGTALLGYFGSDPIVLMPLIWACVWTRTIESLSAAAAATLAALGIIARLALAPE